VILSARGFTPQVDSSCFIAPNTSIIADVHIGERSSVWFGCVLRGDVMPIRIGKEVNIQDNSVLHGTFEKCGVTIADRVTIGHSVILHGCEIGFQSLIGMGTIMMDQAKVPAHCIVGAGSLVTEGSQFEEYSLIMGRPAKFVRKLKPSEIDFLPKSANNYLQYMTWYPAANI
jgi:carbonic anhydrase/acetyltransferase-like protein (isoleucine patch superfamily)